MLQPLEGPLARYFGGALYERPSPELGPSELGLATRTRISGAHDRFPNTTNLRGARLGVSFTKGHEAAVSRASLS
jgi:hypothetical protein